MKIQFTLLLYFFALSTILGQTSLAGSITDAKTGEPLMYANVIVYDQNGEIIRGGASDLVGDYHLKDLEPGTYDLVFQYVGYEKSKIAKVEILANTINYIDGVLSSGTTLPEIVVTGYGGCRRCGGCCLCVVYRDENENRELPVIKRQPESLIYPNPTSSQFTIKSKREIEDANIYNLSGQLVKTLTKGQTQVDVSDLIAGTYFLVITEGEIVQTEKIVIVRD